MAAAQNSVRAVGLHEGSDDAQAERSGNLKRTAAARRLESLGTTAKREQWQGNPAWVADLEYVWRARTEQPRQALEARARVRRKQAAMALAHNQPGLNVTLLRSAEWAEHRARALAMTRGDVITTCRSRWRTIACACGWKEIPVGCDAPQLCSWCRKKHWRKWRHRITRSMDRHVRAARGIWNRDRRYLDGHMLPGVYLITLTGPHSGDLATDREVMGAAWRRLHKTAAGRWWGAYALTWEATSGTDGKGHMHAHVAVVSSWVPYEELHAAWRRAMPGAIVLDVRAPNGARNQAGRAANYLAKYVTKGVDTAEFTGRKAGELLVAFRGRRKVTTSRHFWIPEHKVCRTCNCYHRNVGSPCALQDIAPGAVLRSMAERTRYRDVSRFVLQVQLRGPDDTPLV